MDIRQELFSHPEIQRQLGTDTINGAIEDPALDPERKCCRGEIVIRS